MTAPHTPALPAKLEAFFTRLKASPSVVLMLDYDGTLAPFRVRRNEALPYPGVREILGDIMRAGHTRLVIVSGRSTSDLLPLLALTPHPEIWGSHGWERLAADGSLTVAPMDENAQNGLHRASACLGQRQWANRLETKPGCLAVHWRGMKADARRDVEQHIRQAWEPIASQYGLDIKAFDGGMELRVPGRDKGDAVATLLAESPPGSSVAYLGDDLTDEDAFEALKGRGTGFLVRTEKRPSRADFHLMPPEQLLAFLHRWHDDRKEE